MLFEIYLTMYIYITITAKLNQILVLNRLPPNISHLKFIVVYRHKAGIKYKF